MKADELYRLLKQQLGPWFTAHGFKRLPCSRLAYQRLRGQFYQTIWFQCDKWGWDRYAGSSFFVNFSVSRTPSDFEVGPGHRRHERLNFFLTDEELETARGFRDAIVARIPPPPAAYFETLEAHCSKHSSNAAGMMAVVRSQFEPEPIPYRRHQDFSLRYWQPQDVQGWAAFITAVLPRATTDMASWTVEEGPGSAT